MDHPDAGERLTVAVEVLPAWHQRAGTRLTLLLLALMLIVGGIRWRIGNLRRQARQLTQLVAQRTAALQAERDALARASARNAELMELLSRQAREDSLTGLANRREADRRLAELVHAGQPTLVLIDIDHFKQINDMLGHAVGDLALQTMAAALRAITPAPALCARVGGEEFLLAFEALAAEQVAAVLQQLRKRLLGPELPAGPGVPPLRFSAGLATVRAGESAEAAYRRADGALYAAKAEGRDQTRIAGDP
jgi:diguanylate cyclase (GGDEF)-like protein